jgi:predicted PurR-regulated permease PerM
MARVSSTKVGQELSESQFERVLRNTGGVALVFLGFMALVVALQVAQVFLAPVFLAIVIGLMFGPVADRVEQFGVPPALSSGVVVLLLIGVILLGVVLFAVPLSEWVAKGPAIWEKLQAELANFKEPLAAIGSFQEQLGSVLGSSTAMSVTVENGSGAVTSIAMLAPAILAQVLIFLASLYFFVATRACVSRRRAEGLAVPALHHAD